MAKVKKTDQPQTVTPRLDVELPDPFEDLKKAFKADSTHTLKEVQNAKKDFIAIFGLFAAVLIFLSIEVKIFDQSQRMATTMGISFFFLSALLIFTLAVRNVYTDKDEWKDFLKPAVIFAIVFLVISLECFYWGTHVDSVTHHSQYWFLGSRG